MLTFLYTVRRLVVCVTGNADNVNTGRFCPCENGGDGSSSTPLGDAELFKLVTSVITVISTARRATFTVSFVSANKVVHCRYIITRI